MGFDLVGTENDAPSLQAKTEVQEVIARAKSRGGNWLSKSARTLARASVVGDKDSARAESAVIYAGFALGSGACIALKDDGASDALSKGNAAKYSRACGAYSDWAKARKSEGLPVQYSASSLCGDDGEDALLELSMVLHGAFFPVASAKEVSDEDKAKARLKLLHKRLDDTIAALQELGVLVHVSKPEAPTKTK